MIIVLPRATYGDFSQKKNLRKSLAHAKWKVYYTPDVGQKKFDD